ncbi:hypothetical protein AAG570_003083 [Ranatra chinensis]|uniref:Uncharacterized protein n=1 Tax=Ranatra chinensis TaxID=642074 RepID=A0ABD0Y5T2_9HEMI
MFYENKKRETTEIGTEKGVGEVERPGRAYATIVLIVIRAASTSSGWMPDVDILQEKAESVACSCERHTPHSAKSNKLLNYQRSSGLSEFLLFNTNKNTLVEESFCKGFRINVDDRLLGIGWWSSGTGDRSERCPAFHFPPGDSERQLAAGFPTGVQNWTSREDRTVMTVTMDGKFATLSTLYELKRGRKSRCKRFLANAFHLRQTEGRFASSPDLSSGRWGTGGPRAHSISACVGQVTRCALQILASTGGGRAGDELPQRLPISGSFNPGLGAVWGRLCRRAGAPPRVKRLHGGFSVVYYNRVRLKPLPVTARLLHTVTGDQRPLSTWQNGVELYCDYPQLLKLKMATKRHLNVLPEQQAGDDGNWYAQFAIL